MKKFLFLIASSISFVSAANAATYYIDGANGNDNNAGTAAKPFKDFWRGVQYAQPGDTIVLQPTTIYSSIGISKSGTTGAPITITGGGSSTNMTQISGSGLNFGIDVYGGAHDIVIENLNVTAPGMWGGINISAHSHHITVTGNYVHDAGNCGIASEGADYITISSNRVANNAKVTSTSMFGSGISTFENLDIDTNTGVKMIVENNVVYDNTNTPPCATCSDSDGSGIIIDDTTRSESDHIVYGGTTLVQNNVVFNNGGRGLHIYYSDHVIATANTLFNNNQDPAEGSWQPGEVMVYAGGDIQIYNNIAYSGGGTTKLTGQHVGYSVESSTDGRGAVTLNNNLAFMNSNVSANAFYQRLNTNAVTYGTSNRWGSPRFVVSSANYSSANFHLQAGSPAIGLGAVAMSPTIDIQGTTRNPPPSAGAYEAATN